MSSIYTDHPSPSTMEIKVYRLHIHSADVTAWAATIPANGSQELYVQIKVDQTTENTTKIVKRKDIVFWDEDVLLIGNSSSILSLSIKMRTCEPLSEHLCISHVDVLLGTLLDFYADDQLIPVEMASVPIAPSQPATAMILVKLTDLGVSAVQMETIGIDQLERYQQLGALPDLEDAILNLNMAVMLTDEGHPDEPGYLSNLGSAQKIRFNCLGDLFDLENAISNIAMAVELTDDDHPHKPMYFSNLGNVQGTRFRRLGYLSDLENAISNNAKAVELMHDGHADKPTYFSNLGIVQETRFNHLGDLFDLENAISHLAKAVDFTDDGHPDMPGYLSRLGHAQQTRFVHLGNLSDLENSISNIAKAVELTDDGHPDKPGYLSNLGNAQQTCFVHLGSLSDLENSISNIAKAVELADDGHPDKPGYLSNLGNAQETRFDHLGNLSDLENAISNKARAVELTHDEHPGQPMYLTNLGSAQQTHFNHLGDLSDLESAISNIAKAVDLTDDGHPNMPGYLSNLGNAQQTRFSHFGDLSDLENAISNNTRAVLLTDDGHPSKHSRLSNLGIAQLNRFDRIGNLSDLESAISNIAKAVDFMDDGHPRKPGCLLSLGIAQNNRFNRLGDMCDLENAISNNTKAVKFTDDGHPTKPDCLLNLGIAHQTRFDRLGDLSDIEKAISNIAKAVELIDDRRPDRPIYLSNLGIAKQCRFDRLGDLSDLENAILNKAKAVDLTNDGHPDMPVYLSNLGSSQQARFSRFGDLSDLENAILNKAKAVDLTDDGHPSKPGRLSNLGISQQTRFNRLGDLSDLENAILNKAMAVELTDNIHPDHAMYLCNLGSAQYTRFECLSEEEDFMASIVSFKAAAHLKAAYPHRALLAARQWATISHINGDLQSALEGYRTALELLPKVVWLGLDTPSRQDWLLREKSEDLGSLAAACAIELGNLEAAVEFLDLSRSIFWQQAGSLRSDLELLRLEVPELAKELQRVGHQLDAGNFSHSLVTTGDESVNHHQRSSEETGKARRQLVGLWEGLVEQVRQLPQFKYFLQPIPFDELCQASAGREITVINVNEYRVDALIFGTSQPIEHVPLPGIDLAVLSKLAHDILHQRPAFATGKAQRYYTSRYLKPALRIVWNDIVVPIFDRLDIPLKHSAVIPQRRIWWYPTGPLTFIPLHAAGPWNRSTEAIDVSQLLASSYVTSLSSLLQIQRRSKHVATRGLKLLAVSQPNTSGLHLLPQSIVEAKKLVDAAHLAAVTNSGGSSEPNILHLNGSDATVARVLNALDSFSWVHFACHGSQHPAFGMKSAFALHDGQLELSEIASKNLPSAQFAFLSACHAAAGLKDLPGEAMHLAAGLQFAGFPSVVATMWSICDDDGPTVAEHTYKYLFRNGLQALDPSEAATALNYAILNLRENPEVTVDRWAPFIHFGI